jgi:hypothetical protein
MSSINVNTINEYTGANGVTIDGALIKDGKVTGGAAGLTLITSGSVSAATAIDLDNIFTSTFVNYLITFNGQSNESGNEDLRVRMNAGGSQDTTANTTNAGATPYKEGSSGMNVETALTDTYYRMIAAWLNGTPFTFMLNVLSPQATANTCFHSSLHSMYNSGSHGASVASNISAGIKSETTSFDGIYIYAGGSQTMTGSYRIYGYN